MKNDDEFDLFFQGAMAAYALINNGTIPTSEGMTVPEMGKTFYSQDVHDKIVGLFNQAKRFQHEKNRQEMH